jgi:hypothetical protein
MVMPITASSHSGIDDYRHETGLATNPARETPTTVCEQVRRSGSISWGHDRLAGPFLHHRRSTTFIGLLDNGDCQVRLG